MSGAEITWKRGQWSITGSYGRLQLWSISHGLTRDSPPAVLKTRLPGLKETTGHDTEELAMAAAEGQLRRFRSLIAPEHEERAG